MIQKFSKINKLSGTLNIPGDKSISHRAVMFAAMANGKSTVANLSESEDVKSTINIFRQLGIEINELNHGLEITGRGFKGFSAPGKELYAGNSGTTARLISGLLSAQDFPSVITGDDSLSKRPMDRIITPLSLMGAGINSNSGYLPIEINPTGGLRSINYELPVASAQVKSAVAIAGLHCSDKTIIIENKLTRNHTEKMLGLKVSTYNGINQIEVSKENYPAATQYIVPSDISTASFFIVAALLIPGSEIIIKNVLLNETRAGIIKVLKQMGGSIEILSQKESGGEELGDVLVKHSSLTNINIPEEIIPNVIDEIPILSVAGLFADGDFVIRNAGELRFKESDRIKALADNYKSIGLKVEEFLDGFSISGNIYSSEKTFNSFGDHRIAMAFAVLSSILDGDNSVENFDCVKISNPAFIEQLNFISK